MPRTTILAGLLCLAACNFDLAAAEQYYLEASESSSTNSEDVDNAGSTSGLGPFNTVTSAAAADDDLPGEDAAPDGPQILSFNASPAEVPEAGPVTINIEHTPDVVEVMLFDEYNGATEHLVDLAPGEPWTFAITSEADFEGTHDLHAIVVDDEGRWDEATTVVEADLPPAGSPIWVNEGQDDDEPYFKLGLAAAAVDDGVIVAGRDLNAGMGYSFVRRYSGDSGDVEWTYKTSENVVVSDLEITADGHIAVTGSITKNSISRAWVHMLNADGTPAWDDPQVWLDNSEATTVAVTADGGIYVAGNLTIEGEHTDVFVWHLPANAMPTWATWDSDETLIPNDYASSVVTDSAGRVFVGGSATLAVEDYGPRQRMTVLEYSESTLSLRWTDRASDESTSSILGVTGLGSDLAVAGWREFAGPYVPEARLLKRDNDQNSFSTLWTFDDGGAGGKMLTGIARDPNDRLVVVGTKMGGPDVIELMSLDPDGNNVWTASYQNFAGGDTSASALAIDQYGYVYFTGTLAIDGGHRVVAGKRNP